jgi:soluble P-type ATPase
MPKRSSASRRSIPWWSIRPARSPKGKPRVTAVVPAAGFDESAVLSFGASLEKSSEHPLAAAILAAAAERKVALQEVTNFASITGKGVTGTIGGRRVAVGNAALLKDRGVASADLEARADALRKEGATALFVAVDDRPAGIIAVADPIKATTMAALDALRSEGIRIVMLTGDNRTTAQAVAGKLGITEVEADVLPDQKNAIVRRLKSEGRVVAMAGDGVNDAPALAEADVGIAMGTGTDVAMQSAGLTLVKGDLAGIARGRALSRATMRNIRENLVLAFIYNVVGIPVAAGVLYPAFGLLLSPIIAAAAMSLSSVSVIGNALRLRAATNLSRTMLADRTADENAVAAADTAERETDAARPEADPGRCQVHPVAIAATDDLGITGDDGYAARPGRTAECIDHTAQQGNLQAFFQKYAERHVSRHGAAHREVVDGAVNGQRTDVAAGELERLHRESVGRYDELLISGD